MVDNQKKFIYISSNAVKGGPYSFINNLIYSLKIIDDIEIKKNIFLCDVILLIGENYKLKDLLIFSFFKRTILRLDGRRFCLLSGTKFKRKGRDSLKKFIKSLFFEAKVILAYFLSNEVIYQSDFTRKQWILFEKLFKKKYNIIINPASSLYLKDKKFIKRMINNKYLVVSKGSIHETLLLKQIYEITQKAQIKIYVFGEYSKQLKNKFPNIKFFGYVNHELYKSYLKDCFSFLCIENFACCPNAIIEAQLLGKPILGPNNGALPEMCPNPEFQLISNSSKSKDEIKFILAEYSNNYEYWINKTYKFARNKFGENQYLKYFDLLRETF